MRWAQGWIAVVVMLVAGCSAYRVRPPVEGKVSLPAPSASVGADFLIETVDLIDRNQPIARIGDVFWGGQYQVTLESSLKDYFEAEVVKALQAQGHICARYPGEFAMQRLPQMERSPLHLRLELQELTFSRHPKTEYLADRVVGVCKVRSILLDPGQNVVYQHQFVGDKETYRPTDEIVLPVLGLLSRRGLSRMLQDVLQNTVSDLRQNGIPEIATVLTEYRGGATNQNTGTGTAAQNGLTGGENSRGPSSPPNPPDKRNDDIKF